MSISSYTGSTLPDPTVLIIDDHELVATTLAMSLRSVGLQAQRHAVRSREGILVTSATIPPGVALLDLDLGHDPDGTPIDGITLIEGLCRRWGCRRGRGRGRGRAGRRRAEWSHW